MQTFNDLLNEKIEETDPFFKVHQVIEILIKFGFIVALNEDRKIRLKLPTNMIFMDLAVEVDIAQAYVKVILQGGEKALIFNFCYFSSDAIVNRIKDIIVEEINKV